MKDLFVKNGPYQIDATHLSEHYRLKVLAMILDGAVKQRHVGLDQRDLAPRNVFLIPPPKLTRESTLELTQELPHRVVLIDYNVSTVWELTKHGKRAVQRARLPPNPMKRFWRTTLSDLHGWAPKEVSNPKCFQEWLCQEFGGEKSSLYEPILEELEFYEPPHQDDLGSMHVSIKGNARQGSASNKGPPKKGENEFEVVKAPVMLEGEKPAPRSGPLFDLVRARMKALEMGLCEEKY